MCSVIGATGISGVTSNYGVNATVRRVTPLAVATLAPGRHARYALRWTDQNHPHTKRGIHALNRS
jgi:hypothetical protein